MTAVVVRADARDLPLPDASVDLIVCSPPYFGLRDYGYAGQIGSEATPQEWLASLVACTREWVRVLKPSGSLFVNLGDKYNSAASGQNGHIAEYAKLYARGGGHSVGKSSRRTEAVRNYPQKSLLGLPWRYALACMDELGLILRRDIIWSKPNGLPESVTDRCRSSHEYLFHLVRQPRYYAAVDEIRESYNNPAKNYGPSGGRPNRLTAPADPRDGTQSRVMADMNPLGKLPGSVWSIPSQPLTVPAHLGLDHFAAFPLELPRRVILGWSPPGVCTVCGEGRPSDHKGLQQRLRTAGALSGGIARSTLSDLKGIPSATITGYACACPLPDAPTRPAIILDPFAGTGTTMLAASALGRVGIGCDLSMDYARLARWRTRDRGEIAKAMQVPKPPPVVDGQETLFSLP